MLYLNFIFFPEKLPFKNRNIYKQTTYILITIGEMSKNYKDGRMEHIGTIVYRTFSDIMVNAIVACFNHIDMAQIKKSYQENLRPALSRGLELDVLNPLEIKAALYSIGDLKSRMIAKEIEKDFLEKN